MKVGAIRVNGAKVYGKIEAGKFFPFRISGRSLVDLSDVIAAGRTITSEDNGIPLDNAMLLAPVGPLKKNILCVGKNYKDHSREFAQSGFDSAGNLDLPKHPIIFTKASTTVAAPYASVAATADPTGSVDYEGELGVVIGRNCKNVGKADALDYVYGYTVVNDVTSRELQHRHGQWYIGKNLDGFCPVGPWITTADEMGALDDIRLTTHVNDEQRQSALLKDMIFDIPTLIATLSAYATLEPGDLIATGTPVGVGIGFKPPKYLKPGDKVRISIDRIGEIVNTVV